MKLSENFDSDEFLCPCGECDGGEMEPDFVPALQGLRTDCGFAFPIESAARCQKYNDDLPGSAPESRHVFNEKKKADAVDISPVTTAQKERIIKFAYKWGFKGIGVGANMIHIDRRDTVARWTYPRKKK